MRWAFWRKEPDPPPRSATRKFAPSPSQKGSTDVKRKTEPPAPGEKKGTSYQKLSTKAPSVAPPAAPPPAAAPAAETGPITEKQPTPDAGPSLKERLGEMLVRKGFVSQESLDKALDVQRALRADTHLGEILVREKVLTEEQLATTISRQYKIPFLRIDNYDLKKEVLDLIPGSEARRLRSVPIDRLGRILSVAMVNPLDEVALNDLQQVTGLKIKPIICLATDMKKVLDMYYPSKKGSTIVLRRGDTPRPGDMPSIAPPPSDRVVPGAGTSPVDGGSNAVAETERVIPRRQAETGRNPAADPASRHPMSAPGPQTILRHATAGAAPAVRVRPESQAGAVPAEQVSEEAFDAAVNANPENLLRRAQPQGVRRKAIPAQQIGDAEFALFVGALPKK